MGQLDVDPALSQPASPGLLGDLAPDLPEPPALWDLTVDYHGSSLVPAFEETPPLRLAYLHSVLANVFEHSPILDAQRRLNDELAVIQLCLGTLPTTPRKPARSLVTARKRLGLNVNDYIETKAVCTKCFKIYSTDNIMALESPQCTVHRCPGIIYNETRKRSGPLNMEEDDRAFRRVPAKVATYAPLLKVLPRFFLREEFVRDLDRTTDITPHDVLGKNEYMYDFHDAEAYRSTLLDHARTVHQDGSVQDIKVFSGARRTLRSVRYGQSFTLNLDWFGVTEGRPHSVGAVYLTFNNLHRSVRYLQRNVHLLLVIPGPHEPSLEQLNHMLEPVVEELKSIYSGVLLNVFGEPSPVPMHGAVECHTSDAPASSKLKGTASHSHKTHLCGYCKVVHADLNTDAGYDCEKFTLRDDWEMLSASFRAKTATSKAERKRILDKTGKQYSVMDELTGWLPVSTSAIDFMHNYYDTLSSCTILSTTRTDDAFRGMASHMFNELLIGGYLLDADGWCKLQAAVNSIQWPSGIGRLPTNLGENRGLPKADQWRRWVNIQCTVLWLVWRGEDDKIQRHAPKIPPNAKNKPTFDRDLIKIYRVFLYASLAERILAAKAISHEDVQHGHHFLRWCCKEMVMLGVHLVPNFHYAMHYPQFFRLFGPVYAWWLFAHERFNGALEKVNMNGHADGEMELSLMRNWITKHRLHELISALPADATPEEHALLDRICTEQGAVRGTLRTQIAVFARSSSIILKPKHVKKPTNLRQLPHSNIYRLLLDYIRTQNPTLIIADDMTNTCDHDAIFLADGSAKLLPFICKDGLRFGSTADSRTQADSYGCVDFPDCRTPFHLLYHFEVTIARCSSTELGMYVVHADRLAPMEVVNTSCLSAAVAIVPIASNVRGPASPIWVVHSFDRVRTLFALDGMPSIICNTHTDWHRA
ncbi:hypothetical protein DICSQDRAFT_46259 [Dichomitus squalens LYAD-421 SS1]|uniref:uncharacterized protein n=1 Tax=Dichomitus squalens (strain LYAD-421) TaxID=732165 RepID=UPI0004412B22|nr:uncharacterized protein DICSQDRAFT_46259 [Dichomitus squalens LYAD-421 SS1]EJF67325.1 hypothetical protein DICSQDRAFT_46259 [Dichomitus squalens LYAD-421 SS1]